MEFAKADDLKRKNQHLIGKQYKGATIDELILFPTDIKLSKDYLNIYMQIKDGEQAIKPFSGVDVDVVAVFDKSTIDAQGFLFQTNILNLSSDLGVIID
jgi:hypothetical protein